MAFAITKPSNAGGRADDVRSLKFRVRTLTFSSTYATGGETVTAANVGLKRLLGVLPMDTLVRAANGVTGVVPVFDVAANGSSVAIRMLEDAAGVAGATIGVEKGNAEAYVANSAITAVFVGY